MTQKGNAQDEELLARYRQASAGDRAAPSEAVRATILAESRRIAEQLAKKAPQVFDVSRPAANDSRWKITAFGTVGAALLAALLFAPRYWERPRTTQASTPPKLESLAPPAEPAVAARAPVPAAAPQMAARAAQGGSVYRSADRASSNASSPAKLQSAAAVGDVAQADWLLDQGVSIDARDNAGSTPLMLAVTQGRLEVVRLLLARGADPNAADNAGRTPLQQARDKDFRDVAALLERSGAH